MTGDRYPLDKNNHSRIGLQGVRLGLCPLGQNKRGHKKNVYDKVVMGVPYGLWNCNPGQLRLDRERRVTRICPQPPRTRVWLLR